MIQFTVPGNPQPKQRARTVNGRTYTPKATVEAENAIAGHAYYGTLPSVRKEWPLKGSLRVELAFYRADARRVDSDNLTKCVFDALNGIVWADDSQITLLEVSKHIDRENPRTEVTVTPCP